MKSKFLLFALLISFFSLSIQKGNAQGASVSPTKMTYSLVAGSNEAKKLNIFNNGEITETYSISVLDWTRDTLGNKIYSKAGTDPNSASPYITLSTSLVTLAPKQSASVDVVMNRPASNKEDKCLWSMLFIEPIEEVKETSESTVFETKIKVKYRIGVLIYQNPPSLSYKNLDILQLKVEDDDKISLKVRNTEKSIADASVTFEIANLETGKEYSIDEKGLSVLPLAHRHSTIALPTDLPKGRYSLLAVIDLGLEYDVIAAEIEFEKM